MITAYSNNAKPLAQKAIKELVGCKALLISNDTYYTKNKCSEEYLSKIHEKGWSYLLSKDISRNEVFVSGALNPRYAVMDLKEQVMVVGKNIIPINNFEEVDGVFYSDTKWNKQLSIIKKQTAYEHYSTEEQEILTMGTTDYCPPYAKWDHGTKRWLYQSCVQEKIDYSYPQMRITREGFLNWRDKPDLYTMKLKDGDTDSSDIKTMLQWRNKEMEEIRNLVEINGLANRVEYVELKNQAYAIWLLVETCKNLAKAHKKIDEGNLSAIIDSINVSKYVTQNGTTLPEYMHIYMGDVLKIVK